jgi:hypothetical protein
VSGVRSRPRSTTMKAAIFDVLGRKSVETPLKGPGSEAHTPMVAVSSVVYTFASKRVVLSSIIAKRGNSSPIGSDFLPLQGNHAKLLPPVPSQEIIVQPVHLVAMLSLETICTCAAIWYSSRFGPIRVSKSEELYSSSTC